MGLGVVLRAGVSTCVMGVAVLVAAVSVPATAHAAPLTYSFRTTLHGESATYGNGWFTYDPDVDPDQGIPSNPPWVLRDWKLGQIVFWSQGATNVTPNSFQFGYYDAFVGSLTTKDVAAFHFQDNADGALFALNVENLVGDGAAYESHFLTGTAGLGQPGYATTYGTSFESRFVYPGTLPRQQQDLDLYFPQPVPEPGSLLLLGTGLLGFARLVRSRVSA